MRERMIELLQDIDHYPEKTCPKYGTGEECGDCQYKLETEKGCDLYARKADYLIAKGLIYPPCKVGDVVYRIVNDASPHITEDKVLQIRSDSVEWGLILINNRYISFSDFGKTVFLTKKEAEQALRKEDEGIER